MSDAIRLHFLNPSTPRLDHSRPEKGISDEIADLDGSTGHKGFRIGVKQEHGCPFQMLAVGQTQLLDQRAIIVLQNLRTKAIAADCPLAKPGDNLSVEVILKNVRQNRWQRPTRGCQLISSSRSGTMLELRSHLGLSRDVFARLLLVSTRSLATIESGEGDRIWQMISGLGCWATFGAIRVHCLMRTKPFHVSQAINGSGPVER